jgi:hypothetical protein
MLEYFLVDKFMSKNESFADNSNASSNSVFTYAKIVLIALFILFLVLSLWAASLSWASNTLIGWGIFPKVIFAIFAFLSGIGYLFAHLIYKLDLIRYIKRVKQAESSRNSSWY